MIRVPAAAATSINVVADLQFDRAAGTGELIFSKSIEIFAPKKGLEKIVQGYPGKPPQLNRFLPCLARSDSGAPSGRGAITKNPG